MHSIYFQNIDILTFIKKHSYELYPNKNFFVSDLFSKYWYFNFFENFGSKKVWKEEKQEMRKILKETKGITLIALVLTIIILLILAGVTIATLTGENRHIITISECKEDYRTSRNIWEYKTSIYKCTNRKLYKIRTWF